MTYESQCFVLTTDKQELYMLNELHSRERAGFFVWVHDDLHRQSVNPSMSNLLLYLSKSPAVRMQFMYSSIT